MIEDQNKRVERAVFDMITDMYKTHLRKMQSEMHLCAVNCCDDLNRQPNMDHVQSCIEDCAGPLLRAQDYIQQELALFHTKLQNCVMQCNDDVRGNIPLNSQGSNIAKNPYQFERCVMQCVDKHIGLIPSMMRSVKTVLANGPNAVKKD